MSGRSIGLIMSVVYMDLVPAMIYIYIAIGLSKLISGGTSWG